MKVSDYVVLKVGSIIYLIVDIENDVVKLKGLNYRIYASANIQDVRLATPDEIKLEKEKCEVLIKSCNSHYSQANKLVDAAILDEGEYYYEELIGLECYDSNDNYIGPVIDLQEVPQGLILEIKGKNKTILVPFVEAFIDGIDLEEKKLYINEIEGLL